MISLNEARGEQCDARLTLKTQDQTLIRLAMEGAGLTRWEAGALPRVVEEIYFQGGTNRPWKDGQVRYQCVDITAGAGRKLSECPLVPTALTVIDIDKDRKVLREHGAVALRQSKLMRISEEARKQGGVLTQEDLGVLLSCDERTIRRDIIAFCMRLFKSLPSDQCQISRLADQQAQHNRRVESQVHVRSWAMPRPIDERIASMSWETPADTEAFPIHDQSTRCGLKTQTGLPSTTARSTSRRSPG